MFFVLLARQATRHPVPTFRKEGKQRTSPELSDSNDEQN